MSPTPPWSPLGGSAPRNRRSLTARLAVAGALSGLALSTLAIAGPATAASQISCSSSSVVSGGVLTVASGETCTVAATTTLDRLVIADGGSLVAPDGYDVTLTVDGVELGQDWDSITDAGGTLQPGTYEGADGGGVVLTVTVRHSATGQSMVFPIRQSLFVDAQGVDDSRSVAASWLGGKPGATQAKNFTVTSKGSTFNGVWVDGTTYRLTHPTLSMTGDGRDDFVASGAAITGTNGAQVTVDDATVDDTGVVRTGVVANGGSNVVVKNSTIKAAGGELPSDYTVNVAFDTMVAAPWMLGLEGTNRATLLMGSNTKASYVNSTVSAQDWGALSTDSGSNVKLTAINSTVKAIDSGYGSYLIGNATGDYLGTTMDVADYGIITANGANVVNLGDSDAATVAGLNSSRAIGLSASELAALSERSTTIESDRIGVMTWAGNSTVNVNPGTTVHAGQTVFQDKTSARGNNVVATYNVQGSAAEPVTLTSDRGVLMQVMSNDDPFPASSYTDTTATSSGADLSTTTGASRTDFNLTDTTVRGDVYNAALYAKNLVLTMDGSTLRGVVSASTAVHNGPVDPAHYANIGNVTNTAAAPINNGVIASLTDGSTWTVTGRSYLTKLSVDATSRIRGLGGKSVTITQGSHTYTPGDLVGQTIVGTASEPIVVSVADGAIASTTQVAVANTTYGAAGSAKVSAVDAEGDAATGTVSVAVDGTTVGSATLASGAATVALPAGLDAGSHSVTATYGGAEGTAASSASTSFTVGQVGSTSLLKLPRSTVRKGQRAKAKLQVSAAASTNGTLTVLEGSRVLRAYDLAVTDAGTLKVRLPRLDPGVHRLRVAYSGNTNVAGSSSAVVKLKVVKKHHRKKHHHKSRRQ